MVSLRRRKSLGLRTDTPPGLFRLTEDGTIVRNPDPDNDLVDAHTKPSNGTIVRNFDPDDDLVDVHTKPLNDIVEKIQEQPPANEAANPVSPNIPSSGLSEEEHIQECQEVKIRKPHRRKQAKSGDTCTLKGVYFKNQKWQAAIKVDKKQVHLGTVGSQTEAAKLYDRAAFLLRRETNYDIEEEEQKSLEALSWDGLMEMTRNAISEKRHKKIPVDATKKVSEANKMKLVSGT